MVKFQKYNYALFGNPIDHSKSPYIHNFFSKKTGIFYLYEAINVPLNHFSSTFFDFFKNNGQGANVTAPFKQEAYYFSHKLTKRARIAQSVNTLKKLSDQEILGDNTDGIGLLSDLIRLKFIKKDYSILILGAGGAVKGVLFLLLSFGCSVFILNRTVENAKKLVLQFKKHGNIKVFTQNVFQNKCFDLIINATSGNIHREKNFIPLSLISDTTCFYDMNYQRNNTSFINWCLEIGANSFSNGIGMLVFQAAHSFELWHNIFPEVEHIIRILQKNNIK